MNPFFEYLLKSTISLVLFYVVFKLAVSRDKMHSVNRFVLLGILVTSAILPVAEISVLQENSTIPHIEVFRQIMETSVFNNPQPAFSEEIQTVQPTNPLEINPLLLIYLFAIILLFVRLVVSLVRVAQLIQKAEKQSFQNYILAVVKDFIHPFSFMRNIVISEKDYTENKEIVITHEYAHIKHFHSIDLMICELFTTIYWFNPFMWLLRRDLRLIHEYQADQAVLNKGIDATKYQMLVIEKAVGKRRFAMANHFRQKPILKRIKMMKKKKLNQLNGLKLILFIPVVMLLLQAFSQPEVATNIVADSKPFQYLIGMKYSDYSELGNFTKHSRSSITYPNGEKISAAKLVQGDKQIITSETTTFDEQTNLEVHKIQDIVVLNGYYSTCEGCLLPKNKINIIVSIYSFGVIDDNSLLIAFERNIKTGKYKRVNPDNLERNSKYKAYVNFKNQ